MWGNACERHVKRRGSWFLWRTFLCFSQRVGCDRVLGSAAEPDACGICKGNNSSCKIYKGQYTKQHYTNRTTYSRLYSKDLQRAWPFFCSFSEYYGVVTIPVGARGIRVMELNTSSSYLAVRDTQRRYYLNGHWTVDWPGRHVIAGAIFEYKRPYNRPESLISTGPTNETLVIEVSYKLDLELVLSWYCVLFQHFLVLTQVLLQGWNPGVRWEYTLKKADEKRRHNYTWAVVRSQCSATCAGGEALTLKRIQYLGRLWWLEIKGRVRILILGQYLKLSLTSLIYNKLFSSKLNGEGIVPIITEGTWPVTVWGRWDILLFCWWPAITRAHTC